MAGTVTGAVSMTNVASITGLSTSFSIFNQNTATSANNVTTPSLSSVPVGALLVLSCAAADDHALADTVSITGTGLTWTRQATSWDLSSIHTGQTEIWTAIFAAGGTISPTVTWTGGGSQASSSVLYAFTGQETTPAGAVNDADNQSAPSVAVTTTRADSYLICVSSDWNAIAGTETYRDSATSVLDHDLSPTIYRGYHYYKLTTSIATYTEGISSPSTMAAGTCVYEVRKP